MTIEFAMAVVIHRPGRLWDDSACYDHHDVKLQPLVGRFNSRWLSWIINVAAREPIQLAMTIDVGDSIRHVVLTPEMWPLA